MPDSHRVYSYSAVLMGSPILLKLFSHDEALASRVFRLIKQYEDLLTVNRAHSQVMDINHAAGQHPVAVSRPVFELIRCAKAASLLKDSAFNLAIGPLVKCWKIGFKGDAVPPADEIAALMGITDPADVVLDEANSSVFLTRQGMEIDLGAIAKGYIADRVRDHLHKEGVELGLINLGGNVLCIGSKPDGTPFKIGIQKPFADRNETEAVMDITGKSVVSSGIYERCFKQDGKLYHHILNPQTGYPYDNGLISVTIISDQSVDGDALSTTCFALGLEDGLKFAEKKGVQAVFITEDYELHYTDGFRDEIRVTDVES